MKPYVFLFAEYRDKLELVAYNDGLSSVSLGLQGICRLKSRLQFIIGSFKKFESNFLPASVQFSSFLSLSRHPAYVNFFWLPFLH
jgi:hypothetical protein